LRDDVTFDGPLGHTEGADAYVHGVSPMADNVQGIDLKKTVVDGDDVFILYDLLSEPAGALPAVGWYHFRDDKIASVRAYFDPRPLTQHRAIGSRSATGQPGMPLFAAALQVCLEAD
jgi:hypothetical protein